MGLGWVGLSRMFHMYSYVLVYCKIQLYSCVNRRSLLDEELLCVALSGASLGNRFGFPGSPDGRRLGCLILETHL